MLHVSLALLLRALLLCTSKRMAQQHH